MPSSARPVEVVLDLVKEAMADTRETSCDSIALMLSASLIQPQKRQDKQVPKLLFGLLSAGRFVESRLQYETSMNLFCASFLRLSVEVIKTVLGKV
jgi:hypothetical protein